MYNEQDEKSCNLSLYQGKIIEDSTKPTEIIFDFSAHQGALQNKPLFYADIQLSFKRTDRSIKHTDYTRFKLRLKSPNQNNSENYFLLFDGSNNQAGYERTDQHSDFINNSYKKYSYSLGAGAFLGSHVCTQDNNDCKWILNIENSLPDDSNLVITDVGLTLYPMKKIDNP
jgi:hypothetical protein